MLGFIRLSTRKRKAKTKNLAPMARVLHAATSGAFPLSHSRIPYRNLSGRACTTLEVLYSNWIYNATAETGSTATITVRAAIEYPAGVITPLTTDGATRNTAITPAMYVSNALKASGLNIPSGAIFWIRTRAIVSGGDGLISTAYDNAATFEGGTVQGWTGANDGSDYTTSGTQPTVTGSVFGPVAVCSREFGNPSRSFAILGDSIARGSSSSYVSYAEIAIQARGRMYLNVSYPASRINTASNKTMPYRRALLKAANCLDCMIGFPINDLGSGFSNATIQSDMITLWTNLKNDGFGSIIQCTCSPRTTTDINTPEPAPAGFFTGGASSWRSVYNAWLRTQAGLSNRPNYVYEFADILEQSRDSGKWKDATLTTDFLHPNITGASFAGDDAGYFLQTIGYRNTISFPSAIANLKLWLDASDTSTLTTVSGGVSQWNDKSGNNLHALQVGAIYQPISGTRKINRLNVLDFDGTEKRMLIPSGINGLTNGNNTVFVVYNTDNTTTARRFLNGVTSGSVYLLSQNGSQVSFMHRTDFTGTSVVTAASNQTAHVAIGVREGVNCTAGRDGIFGTPLTTAQNMTLNQLWIGSSSVSEMMDGVIAEIIMYDRALTSSEINQVGAYLANKWGFLWHAS